MKSILPVQSVRNEIQSGYIGVSSPMWEYAPELSGHLNRCTTELRKATIQLDEIHSAIGRILDGFNVPFASMLPEGAKKSFRTWEEKRVLAQSAYDSAYAKVSEVRNLLTSFVEVLGGEK